MNRERIEKLGEQADLLGECTPTKIPGRYVGYITEEQILKFAELIVRECATYLNGRTEDWGAHLRWIFNDGSGFMEVDVDSLLKEHFGVEE